MEYYETINRDLIELISKSLTFNDIETVGKDIFGDYCTHDLENASPIVSIAPATAAKRLIIECEKKKKLETLITVLMQLDGNMMNHRIVKLAHVENFLYHLVQSGTLYDYQKRKLVQVKKEHALLPNWGSLKDGREYTLTVVSIDIVKNSELVQKHGTRLMEKVYLSLHDYIRGKLSPYDGRVWSWAGDGGLIAFPKGCDVNLSVSCCLEILLSLPVYNVHPMKKIKDDIVLRIAVDHGAVKFFSDTGRIVSKAINYVAHLEKKGTKPNGLSVSNTVYKELTSNLQKCFPNKQVFEGRTAYSRVVDNKMVNTANKKSAQTANKKSAPRKK